MSSITFTAATMEDFHAYRRNFGPEGRKGIVPVIWQQNPDKHVVHGTFRPVLRKEFTFRCLVSGGVEAVVVTTATRAGLHEVMRAMSPRNIYVEVLG